MGALPGGGFLTAGWFEVDRYRSATVRRAVVWRPTRTTLVLGSTQPRSVVDVEAAAAAGIPVVRRRSGGGAVLVVPGETVWVDVWVPRGDPLWADDVVRSAGWVGEWWAAGLGTLVAAPLTVHHGGSVPAPWSNVVCFAGVGPGEVLAGDRKLVGLAQWRSREGALFHGCCYRQWDPSDLLHLVGVADDEGLVRSAAVGLDGLGAGAAAVETVARALVDALPDRPAWEVADY